MISMSIMLIGSFPLGLIAGSVIVDDETKLYRVE